MRVIIGILYSGDHMEFWILKPISAIHTIGLADSGYS